MKTARPQEESTCQRCYISGRLQLQVAPQITVAAGCRCTTPCTCHNHSYT
ncbi:hypothetical protein KKE26_11835 [bacterium]|nr:hypothetical protein [bacterium]